ncbi:flagellar filament capping protein FliD [Shewanella intestini]|uniref:Flagellar hook-associated protein 2 n=1 Tax=Shewanella intestini TaxID=2017544 RepID=A0ABS5HYB1_9GAMM|nr:MULTISPECIES: flagellar filament capping protein FliD [Shewanella]MBR9726761.1 flagellar filament capping protein FliD [Shewanella intestini]MRG34673.1 flagellar filament capping protein FliD [Shewanella sp. XMDDZSB0408]
MALTSTGIGSGLDITNIVKVLVDSEKTPKEARFNQTESTIKAKVSAIGTLKSNLSSFQDALEKLKDGASLNQRTVSTGDSEYVSATASKDAQSGTYNIEVEQLAKPHKVGGTFTSDGSQTVGGGRIDLNVGSESFGVDIDATDSLDAIAKKVNDSTDNPGVTATVITSDSGSRLVFSSDTTGTDSQISINATDSAGTGLSDMFNGGNLTEIQAAQNSIVHIDGQKVTSQTNTVSGAITGVTLDLTKADINESSTLSITLDEEGVKENVQGFVDSYNTLMDSMKKLSSYDADKNESAALQGDSIIRSLEGQLRGIISTRVDNDDGSSSALYDIGIKTDRYGKLSIDDDKLDKTIANDMGHVESLFSSDKTGVAVRLDDLANTYVKTGGVIAGRENTYTRETSRLEDQRETFALRMEQLESRLTKQYNAMDLVVANLNQQSSGLMDRINSLPGVIKQ